jgi:hypothetical protein
MPSTASTYLQRTAHRVGRTSKRDHEAVALALFDRVDAVISGDHIGERAVELRDRGGHLVALGLPQPRGALDVGQNQRDRSVGSSLTPSSLQSVASC